MWVENLQHLRQYWSLFNGRKLITVATGPGLLPPATVARHLPEDPHIELAQIENVPQLGESHALFNMLAELRKRATPGITFYGHAKGVTRSYSQSVRSWNQLAYKHNLEISHEALTARLKQRPISGCFRRLGSFAPAMGNWHYSGSFYWFSNSAVFAHAWSELPVSYFTSEIWLGELFKPCESFCNFADNEKAAVFYSYAPQHWESLQARESQLAEMRQAFLQTTSPCFTDYGELRVAVILRATRSESVPQLLQIAQQLHAKLPKAVVYLLQPHAPSVRHIHVRDIHCSEHQESWQAYLRWLQFLYRRVCLYDLVLCGSDENYDGVSWEQMAARFLDPEQLDKVLCGACQQLHWGFAGWQPASQTPTTAVAEIAQTLALRAETTEVYPVGNWAWLRPEALNIYTKDRDQFLGYDYRKEPEKSRLAASIALAAARSYGYRVDWLG